MKSVPSLSRLLHWTYISKVFITALCYYATADIAFYLGTHQMVFNHDLYTVFWPPAGISLALMMVWGLSIWPGIVIGSIFRTTGLDFSQIEFISSTTIFTLFAVGRVLEPIAGRMLLKKVGILDTPLKGPKNTVYFILIAMTVAIISSGLSAIGAQLLHHDPIRIFITRLFGWYIDNVIGILIFTPLTYAVVTASTKSWRQRDAILPILVMTVMACFLLFIIPHERLSTMNIVVESTLPFLVIPLILWISFNFNLIITSYAVFIVSIIVVYFTSNEVGPFITTGNFQHAVWILQSFMFVIATASLVSFSASSERRENLLQLEEAKFKAEESDRLKSAFLANMSHEIRTPMNAVMGFAELLGRPGLAIDKREEFAHLIRKRSEDLLTVVNDILDISKIESGQIVSKPSAGNLAELLDQLMKTYSAELRLLHGKTIELKIRNELIGAENLVMADFPRLQQVFENLLSNALKFTEKGSIELGCKLQHIDNLLFYVRDTGIGIDPAKHATIFKPFQQASHTTHQQYGGSGLGLAIIKGLIKLWDGKIWVESEVGKGAVFFFTMPYVKADQSGFKNRIMN